MTLLLPYAHDSEGNLTHIDNAQKGQEYTCPTCKNSVLLKISKIPQGQKYHKRNHFAHKGKSENHCSETFLHKTFKNKCAELICEKLNSKEDLHFVWQCSKCHNKQSINLLNGVVAVDSEHHINNDKNSPKPDIILLDNNGKVIMAIEIVVTHKPEQNVLQYYKENNIICLQINISDFEECEKIEEILTNSDKTILHSHIQCNECSKNIRIINNTTKYTNTQHVKNNPPLIEFLRTKGNKICAKCGNKLEIQIMEHGAPYLRCEKYPQCPHAEYLKDYDHIIFPNMAKKRSN